MFVFKSLRVWTLVLLAMLCGVVASASPAPGTVFDRGGNFPYLFNMPVGLNNVTAIAANQDDN